jgi:hypothetical protein
VTGWGETVRVRRVSDAGINQSDGDSDSQESSEDSEGEGGSD